MKYYPECRDYFETVQDIFDRVGKFQGLYNDHPHSSLKYVRPNDERAGLGDTIRKTRQENLKTAIAKRHAYYKSKKEVVPNYGLSKDHGSGSILGPVFAAQPAEDA